MKLVGVVAAACLASCLAVGVAEAQAPQSERLLELGGAFATKVRNSDSSIGTQIQSSQAWARLSVPISLGGGNALVLGLSYEGQFISYSDFVPQNVGGTTLTQNILPTPLHSLDARVGVVWRFAERWSAAAHFTPGLHSDFGDIRSRDVFWGGSLLLVHPFGDECPGGGTNRIGFGAAFTDRFGSPLPIPLLLLDWYPSEDWFVRGTLPVDLDVGYRISRPLSVGVGALLKGHMYRLEAAPFSGQVIRYREVQIGPFLDYGLTQHIRLHVGGGVSAGHHFELRDENNDNTLISGDFKPGGFFRGSIYYAL